MPTYLHPGVYIEEISSGSKPIEGVSTSVTAFVGEVAQGPVGEATLIQKWDDYVDEFGDIASEDDAMGLAVRAFYLNGGGAAYICRLVDANSGSVKASSSVVGEDSGGADVIQIAATSEGEWGNSIFYQITKDSADSLSFDLSIGYPEDGEFIVEESFSDLTMNDQDDNYVIKQVNGTSKYVEVSLEEAGDPDEGANVYIAGTLTGGNVSTANAFFNDNISGDVSIRLSINGLSSKLITIASAGDLLDGTDNLADGQAIADAIKDRVNMLDPSVDAYANFNCTYAHDSGNGIFTMTSGEASPSSEVKVFTGELADLMELSSNDAVSVHGSSPAIPQQTLGTADLGEQLQDGEASAPKEADFTSFYGSTLVKVRDVSIMVLPGQEWADDGSGNSIISATLSHCESTKSRVLVVDPPQGYELDKASTVSDMGLPTSSYSFSYYPWVKVSNPFYDSDTNPNASTTLTIAPSAFAAGMCAKIDGSRGVWKAPAGVETNLLGVAGLEYQVEDGEQDQLNPLGINCFRKLPNFGSVIWGSRTLSTKANPEWRYVPVRRTAIFIEQSLYNGIQWAVFEPNDHRLWSSLRANIDSFMNGLFRSGAFQGEKASDAYFVRCGLGDTMNQGDIDRGQVIVQVGFAPLKPAEFVIVRLQQKVGQQ